MKKLIQVDFHPDGRVVKIYEGDVVQVSNISTRGMTPKEALQKRVEEYKKNKRSNKQS